MDGAERRQEPVEERPGFLGRSAVQYHRLHRGGDGRANPSEDELISFRPAASSVVIGGSGWRGCIIKDMSEVMEL